MPEEEKHYIAEYRSESERNDDLTITQKQLRNALAILGPANRPGVYAGNYVTTSGAAATLVNLARDGGLLTEQSGIAPQSPDEEESITRKQLTNALEIAGYPSDVGYVIRPATRPFLSARMTAADAVHAIWKAKDEAEYKPGDVVKDAAGRLYQRAYTGWLMFGKSDTIGLGVPVRPLQKVEEGK